MKKKIAVVAMSLLMAIESVGAPGVSAKGSAVKYQQGTRKVVKTENKCTNLGCMCFAGKMVFMLKANTDNTKAVLYSCEEKTGNKLKVVKSGIKNLGHANSMAYAGSSYFYVALGKEKIKNSQTNKTEQVETNKIAKLRKDGKYMKTYTAQYVEVSKDKKDENGNPLKTYTKKNVQAITNYGSRYIVQVNRDSGTDTKYKFGIGSFKKNNFEITEYFYVDASTLAQYDVRNDIHFQKVIVEENGKKITKKYLYLTLSKKMKKGDKPKNAIVVVEMNDNKAVIIKEKENNKKDSKIVDKKVYKPSRPININLDKNSGFSIFEIEGICMNGQGDLLFCSNAVKKKKEHDTYYRIKKAALRQVEKKVMSTPKPTNTPKP